MADKKSKNNKKSSAKAKPQVTEKKTTAQKTPAKKPAKTVAKPKTAKRTEPKPSAKVMKELEQLAKKHGANAPVKPAPKVNARKSAEAIIAPPKNGKVKEVTVKYKFE